MDDFSDDDFDHLNANALAELENNAIQFTQAQQRTGSTQQASRDYDYEQDFDDDDLDDAVVIDDLRGKSVSVVAPPEKPSLPVPTSVRIAAPQQRNAWESTAGPASQFRPQAVGSAGRQASQSRMVSHPPQPAYSQMRPPPPPQQLGRSTGTTTTMSAAHSRYQASQAPQRGAPDHSALEAQIAELQQKLQHKNGEIDIVRRRLDKSRQDHERELQAMQKQTAEQVAKFEREAEVAKLAQRSAATELEFTRCELRNEVDRAKRKDKDGGGSPRKNAAAKAWGVSDGFEAVEMAASPSKGSRSRNQGPVASVVQEPPARLTRTPTKSKRKRPLNDSPVMALETDEDVVMLDGIGTGGATRNANSALSVSAPPKKSLPVDFMKVVLNHCSGHGRPLTLDLLARFSLPSRPGESISAILLQKLSVMGDPNDCMRLPIEFCDQVIDLWLQCRRAGCLAPITELVSLISFTLQLNTIAIAPYIAESLVSTAMDSCYEIGIPRLHNQSSVGDPGDATFMNLKENIPTSTILSVLYLTALGCAASPPIRGTLSRPIVDFWNCVPPDFVLMMIKNHNQPVDDFITVLNLLCTSSLAESIGPISTSPNRTVDMVAPIMMERLTYHLIETQQWNVGLEKRRTVCFAILRALAAFARSPYGMRQLAVHDYAIPRLVMFLSWSIDELYDGDDILPAYVFPELDGPSPASAGHAEGGDGSETVPPPPRQQPNELQTLIAHTMLLLHTIVSDRDNQAELNVPAKLAKFTGASQKYLLSLARLNFAEEGVSEETAELAHELLESLVTEEEGAELGQFFGA